MEDSSCRQRDILPLPLFDECSFDPNVKVSRAVERRICRRGHAQRWANQAIRTLNKLGGHGLSEPDPSAVLGKGSKDALDGIAARFREFSITDCDLSPDGAFRELLAKSGVYTGERPDVCAYNKELVSWPALGSLPCELLHGLSEPDRALLSDWQSTMLIGERDSNNPTVDSAESPPTTPTKPHCDKKLFSSPKNYAGFLERMHRSNMLGWKKSGPDHSGILGVFFVLKKDGSLRIIFDTQLLNAAFRDPPKTHLPTAAGFGNLEAEQGLEVNVASADIRNAFYVLGIPDDLAQMFTLPGIKCKHLRHFMPHLNYTDDTYVTPYLKVLPMGWSWSLHL